MLELLAFLLPIAAASGWYAARQHYTRKFLLDHARPLTRAYCRGLNYLLNEKTDQAIDVFADLLEKDFGTAETHLALGNLFRRRGEVEKAIDIHETLLRHPGLTEEVKSQGYFELGMDYQRAGLFDRAEAIFKELIHSEPHRAPSLHQLLQIYEQEKDWISAIECTRYLTRYTRTPRGETIAQFLCELAEQAIAEGRYEAAREHLAQAGREDAKCVRVSLIQARIELAAQNFREALEVLRRVEYQDPVYLPEILVPMGVCYQRLAREQEYLDYLSHLYHAYGLVEAAVEVADRLRRQSGSMAADYLLGVLESRPGFRGLSDAIGMLAMSDTKVQEAALHRVGRIIENIESDNLRYRCCRCGFAGSELHWRCPSCQCWSSIKPI
jgi:lipopolysaccharide biosynthesis regulator YciM